MEVKIGDIVYSPELKWWCRVTGFDLAGEHCQLSFKVFILDALNPENVGKLAHISPPIKVELIERSEVYRLLPRLKVLPKMSRGQWLEVVMRSGEVLTIEAAEFIYPPINALDSEPRVRGVCQSPFSDREGEIVWGYLKDIIQVRAVFSTIDEA